MDLWTWEIMRTMQMMKDEGSQSVSLEYRGIKMHESIDRSIVATITILSQYM